MSDDIKESGCHIPGKLESSQVATQGGVECEKVGTGRCFDCGSYILNWATKCDYEGCSNLLCSQCNLDPIKKSKYHGTPFKKGIVSPLSAILAMHMERNYMYCDIHIKEMVKAEELPKFCDE